MSAWHKRKAESIAAYAAFQLYLDHGSIDAAWRASDARQERDGKRAHGNWAKWSSKHEWVSRAAAYASHLAERNRALWEARKEESRERDWTQADSLRRVVDDAIPTANLFIRRNVSHVGGETIITLSFDITGLAMVLEKASKMQRLASDQPTENINNLSGAALDAAIKRALDELSDRGQAPDAGLAADPEAETDESTEPDAYDL